MRVAPIFYLAMGITFPATATQAVETRPIAPWVENLLLGAHVSGNLESYGKGVRGTPEHIALRLGEPLRCEAEPILGAVSSWHWNFGDGAESTTSNTTHTYAKTGLYEVTLEFSGAKHQGYLKSNVSVGTPIESRIAPLMKRVRVGDPSHPADRRRGDEE